MSRLLGGIEGVVAAVRNSALWLAILGVVALWAGTAASKANHDRIVLMLISVVLVVGLQIYSGNSGILSFGSMVFAGVGAYTTSLLTLDPSMKEALTSLPEWARQGQWDLLPALAAAAVIAAIVGLVTGSILLRVTGSSAVIVIFAYLLASNVIFNGWSGLTQGAGGLFAIPRLTTLTIAFVCAAAAIVVARCFRDSSAGLRLRASRDDEIAAAASGVPVGQLRLRAWVIGGIVSGIGGGLLAHQLTAISPSNFYLAQTFIVVAMLIVGGIGTVSGAVAGVLMVTGVQELLRPIENSGFDVGLFAIEGFPGLTQLALVALILGTMYLRPDGMFGREEVSLASLAAGARRAVRAIRRWRHRADREDTIADPASRFTR